jgi:hypothetical protein
MESYRLEGFPPEYSTVHIALFHGVTNAADLRQKLVTVASAQGIDAETERNKLDYAFIDASLVREGDRWHISRIQLTYPYRWSAENIFTWPSIKLYWLCRRIA